MINFFAITAVARHVTVPVHETHLQTCFPVSSWQSNPSPSHQNFEPSSNTSMLPVRKQCQPLPPSITHTMLHHNTLEGVEGPTAAAKQRHRSQSVRVGVAFPFDNEFATLITTRSAQATSHPVQLRHFQPRSWFVFSNPWRQSQMTHVFPSFFFRCALGADAARRVTQMHGEVDKKNCNLRIHSKATALPTRPTTQRGNR